MWKNLFGTRTETWTVAGLLLRLLLAAIFIFHGWGKVWDLAAFTTNVGKMGIAYPHVLGPVAALSEFVGGMFLAAGALTRFWALMLTAVMAVAVFRVHGPAGFSNQGGGFEYPLTLLVCCLVLLMMGPGKISVDDRI